jgi:predicted amidohydrolase YtcJ
LQVLNLEEKVSPYEALKAITINVAKQHREEKTKGTLTVGKLADLVILSANPVKVCVMVFSACDSVEALVRLLLFMTEACVCAGGCRLCL